MKEEKEKYINSSQAVKLAKRFNIITTKEHVLKNFKNGDFLFRRKNIETGIMIDYFLHEIYIRKFSKKYSASPNIKSGKELLISNFELPKGKILNN